MTELAVRPAPGGRRHHDVRLAVAQFGYAWRDFWRTTVMAFVVIGFPLVFLLMLGISQGEAAGGTAAEGFQASAPNAAVFSSVLAAYVMLPFGIAQARERGVLKRLRGSPLPIWAYLVGRISTAVVVAAIGTGLMLATAIIAFGLELPGRLIPAMSVTFIVGVVCFAALGLAVVALLRGVEVVMSFTMGSFLLTAFASGTFAPDIALPRPLDVASWFLPLRHLTSAFGGTFEPATAGAGFAWDHLGVLVLWAAVAAVVATRRLAWEPTTRSVGGARRRGVGDRAEPGPAVAGAGGHSLTALAWGQFRHANRGLWRQPSSVFFSVAFPVLFAIVVPYAFGHPVIDGVRFAELVVPAMAVFGAVITAYVNLPEAVAIQRDEGILKRLRGTPLPASAYVVGRLGSAVWIGALTVVAVFAVGGLVHDVAVAWSAVLPLVVVFVAGILAMAGLGLAVVALVPNAASVPAVSLATFLPLAFISDMLAFGVELPGPLQAIGWVFPIKHFVYATDSALAGGLGWGYLGGLVAWGLVGAGVAVWRFRWDP